MVLLADTVTAETGVSLGFLLAVIMPVGTAVVTAIIARVLHGVAIKDLRESQGEFKTCVQDLTKRVQELETDRKIRDALNEDRASEVTPRPVDVSRSGIRPRSPRS